VCDAVAGKRAAAQVLGALVGPGWSGAGRGVGVRATPRGGATERGARDESRNGTACAEEEEKQEGASGWAGARKGRWA
jgi:hypothetical protein